MTPPQASIFVDTISRNSMKCKYLRSITITLKVQLALLPDPSVKVYVTWVVPTWKNCPGLAVLDDRFGTWPELSVAVGSVQDTVVPPTPLPTVAETSLIQAMVGGMVSTDWIKI